MRITKPGVSWAIAIVLGIAAGLNFRPAQIALSLLFVLWLMFAALPWLVAQVAPLSER
jgi:uncharacterized membrane protein HdeD (DUF308 family)